MADLEDMEEDEDCGPFPNVDEVAVLRFGSVPKAYCFATGELVELEKPAVDYVTIVRNDEAVFSSESLDHVVRAADVFKSKVEKQNGQFMIKLTDSGIWRSLEDSKNYFEVKVFNGVVKDSMHT